MFGDISGPRPLGNINNTAFTFSSLTITGNQNAYNSLFDSLIVYGNSFLAGSVLSKLNTLDDGSSGCTLGNSGSASVNIGNASATTTILGTININNTGTENTNINAAAGTLTIGSSSTFAGNGHDVAILSFPSNSGNFSVLTATTLTNSMTFGSDTGPTTFNTHGTININTSGSSSINIGTGTYTGTVSIGGNAINITGNSTAGVSIGNGLNTVYIGSQGGSSSVVNIQPGTGSNTTNICASSGYSGILTIGNTSMTGFNVNVVGIASGINITQNINGGNYGISLTPTSTSTSYRTAIKFGAGSLDQWEIGTDSSATKTLDFYLYNSNLSKHGFKIAQSGSNLSFNSQNNILDDGSGKMNIVSTLSMNSQVADNTIQLYNVAGNIYGFGIQSGQLVYNITSSGTNFHNFYSGGSSGTKLFSISSTKAVTTFNNILDDGNGNAIFKTQNIGGVALTVDTNTASTATYLYFSNNGTQKVGLKWDSSNGFQAFDQSAGIIWRQGSTSIASLYSHNNTLDDGNGVITINYSTEGPGLIMNESTTGYSSYTRYSNTVSGRNCYVGLDGAGLAGVDAGALWLSTDGTGNKPIYLSAGNSTTWGLKVASGQVVSTTKNTLDNGSGAATFAGAVTITPTSNQLILGTTNTTTITSTAPSASRTYTIPDVGHNANFVFDSSGNTTTISGNWTFNGTTTLSGAVANQVQQFSPHQIGVVTTYTLTATSNTVQLRNYSGTTDIYLPASTASTNTMSFLIMNITSGNVTVHAAAGDTIYWDGGSATTITIFSATAAWLYSIENLGWAQFGNKPL